jgi:hypothetical protein
LRGSDELEFSFADRSTGCCARPQRIQSLAAHFEATGFVEPIVCQTWNLGQQLGGVNELWVSNIVDMQMQFLITLAFYLQLKNKVT